MPANPYYLNPDATNLPAGEDPTLKHVDAPRPPFRWPVASTAPGPAGPPEAALAPPGVDPARRTTGPMSWPVVTGGIVTPNRPMAETGAHPNITLDPDIDLWPRVVVNMWPFTGHPTVGVWPLGWLGIDNTGTVYVCTSGGSPGTWAAVGFTSAGVASFNTRTGAVVFTLADAETIFTGADQLLVGTGAGTGALLATGSARIYMSTGGTNFLPNNTNTQITFDSVDYQAGSVSTSTSNVLTIGTTGKHMINAQVYVVAAAGITRYVGTVLVNGTIRLQSEATANANFACLTFNSPLSLSSGDVVSVKAQVSGGSSACSVETAASDTYLAATLLPT